MQEGEATVKHRSDLDFFCLQAARDLLPVVYLPVQDPKVHPVAAVQVGGYPGHRALRFAALPGDLHLCLPGTMGAGEDRGADQVLRCSPRSLWLTKLCADREGPSAAKSHAGPWGTTWWTMMGQKESLCFWSLLQTHCKVLTSLRFNSCLIDCFQRGLRCCRAGGKISDKHAA